jgi:hypothetical protein
MEPLSLDTISLQQLSEKKPNNVSLFREKPPIELVGHILRHMGFENGILDSRSFTKDDLKEETAEEWLPMLEPYYLPCKAKRFLEYLTRDKYVTIIRHLLRIHNFDLRTQERLVGGVKRTHYRIEPQTPSFNSKGNVFIEFN